MEVNVQTRSLTIIKRVLRAFNSAYNTHIFACAIHKKCFPTKDPVEMAFEDLCSRFEMFLDSYIMNVEKKNLKGELLYLTKPVTKPVYRN